MIMFVGFCNDKKQWFNWHRMWIITLFLFSYVVTQQWYKVIESNETFNDYLF